MLAMLAIVIASLALGLVLWREVLSAPAACQSTVWSAQPAANLLPDQWSVKGTSFDVNRRSTQFADAEDGVSAGSANVLATVTCFPQGAAEVVARAQAAAREIGQVVSARTDLSDGGFEATDASGAIFLEFRRGDVVVDLAASGGATATDIETVASAYDRALGGPGGSITPAAPTASGGAASGSPGPSGSADAGLPHDAAELERLLPTKVAGVTLTIDSLLGGAILTADSGGQAAIDSLKAAGKVPDDLRYAEATDQSQTLDLSVVAISVRGLDGARVQTLLVGWFDGGTGAVTRTEVTLAGKPWTRYVSAGDQSANYMRTEGDAVLVITTSDPALAQQAAAALP